jgi:hypothetical protein
MKRSLQEKLLSLIMTSSRSDLMPVRLAKGLLDLYREGLLFSDDGFRLTLEGSLILEKEDTLRIFSEEPSLLRSFKKVPEFIGVE